MAFKPEPKPPQFADLKGMLAQSKSTDNALNQTLTILIDRLDQIGEARAEVIQKINNSVNTITSYVTYLTNNTATYLTTAPEEVALANSSQLLPGANITFDMSIPHRLKINATGGGGTGGGMNLDYLGNYVQGPVYNDGDIVIGADGVAYMCTVDGTVTPPEPWPGVGVGVNVGLDATYWIAQPHSSLVNARVMNGRGNGYVKSIAGEPNVVATIPLTDTTGILPDNRLTSNVALKNINNNFVTQTFSAWSSFTGANSAVVYNDTSAPVDGKVWRTLNYSNGNFYIEATADDQSAVVAQFAFIRAGAGLHAGYFAGDGSNLTNLNASNLALGLANPARLGSGTANSSTYLRGDSTWATLPAGLEPFPSGMIVLSAGVPCAIGWTRVTAWDGNFIRLGPGGTGGAASHSHGPGTMAALGGHNHGGQTGPADIIINPNTTLSGDHTHPFSGSIAGTTGAAGGPTSGTDAGGSFTSAYSSHTHDFSAGYSGTTGGGGNHSHGITVTGGGRSSIAAEAAIPLSGVTDAQSNLPPYIDLWLCQKN